MFFKRVMGLDSLSFYCVRSTGLLCLMVPSRYAACAPQRHKTVGSTSRGLTWFFLCKVVISDVHFSNGQWTVLQGSILTTPVCIFALWCGFMYFFFFYRVHPVR